MKDETFFSDLVIRLINTRTDKLERFFDSSDRFEDAIEFSKASMVAGIRDDSMFSPERHIQTRLGHVSVNPNDPANTAILRDSYVYAYEETPQNKERVINSSPSSAESFLRALLKKAQEFRHLSVSHDTPDPTGLVLSNERNFLILGERGCGKTFFINHLFSKFHQLLDEEKVVWVRVNLVPDRGFDDNIHNWIYAQVAKILLRYYDIDSERNPRMPSSCKASFYKATRAWVANNFLDDQRERYIDSLEEMRQAFGVSENDQEISPALCNPIICRQMYRIARKMGFAFIIVLDGLDRLESDHYYTERFANISRTVRTLWGSYETLGCIFVYVTRGETFDANRNVAPYNMFGPTDSFSIQSAKIGKIFQARIDAITTEILELQKDKPESWGEKDWVGIVNGFRERIFDKNEQIETASYLDATFTTNNRAKVQIVQLRFQEYMRTVSRQAYKLIELMMLAGWRFPPQYYQYKLVNEHLEIRIPDQSHIDNRYLPVITRPPLPTTDGKLKSGWYRAESLLLGIRLLQLVSGYERWANTQAQALEPITVSNVVDILKGLFGYPQEQIVSFIWELDNFEILRPIYNGNGIERTENTYLGTFPKAKYILDTCLSDVAYLSLCGMRTPINREYHKSHRPFRAAYLDYNDPRSFERWAVAKVVNTTSLAMLLHYANEKQRTKFATRINELKLAPNLMRFVRLGMPPMFDFLENIMPSVRRELTSIYVSSTKAHTPLNIDPERFENALKSLAQRLIEQ